MSGPEFKDAGQAFEYFRPKIRGAGGWFRPTGRAKDKLLAKFKYLMACLEDVSRIESLRLRVVEAREGRLSFQKLEQAVATSRNKEPAPGSDTERPAVAFAIV